MTSDDPDMGGYLAWYKIGQFEKDLDRVPTPDWTGMSDDDRALAMVAYMAGRDGKPVTFVSAGITHPTPDLIEAPRETSKPIIDLDARRRNPPPKAKRTTSRRKGK